MFHLFTTGKYCKDQEFDFILIFGEYKRYVHIEVKAGEFGAPGWVDQLKKGKKFFEIVKAALGNDEYKGWEFIPVGAFPNAISRDKVNCKVIENLKFI